LIDCLVLHHASNNEWLEPCPGCSLCLWAGGYVLDRQEYLCIACLRLEFDSREVLTAYENPTKSK